MTQTAFRHLGNGSDWCGRLRRLPLAGLLLPPALLLLELRPPPLGQRLTVTICGRSGAGGSAGSAAATGSVGVGRACRHPQGRARLHLPVRREMAGVRPSQVGDGTVKQNIIQHMARWRKLSVALQYTFGHSSRAELALIVPLNFRDDQHLKSRMLQSSGCGCAALWVSLSPSLRPPELAGGIASCWQSRSPSRRSASAFHNCSRIRP